MVQFDVEQARLIVCANEACPRRFELAMLRTGEREVANARHCARQKNGHLCPSSWIPYGGSPKRLGRKRRFRMQSSPRWYRVIGGCTAKHRSWYPRSSRDFGVPAMAIAIRRV